MKKKWIALLLVSGMLFTALAGCGSKGENAAETTAGTSSKEGVQQEEAAAGEPTKEAAGGTDETAAGGSEKAFTLTFWNAALNDIDDSGNYADDELAFHIAMNRYKELYPNAEIEVVRYGVDELNQLLTAASLSGDLPDVICTWAGSYTNNYKQLLLDLEQYMTPEEVEEYTGLDICREDMRPDGKLQALPEGLTTYNVFYNKEVFKAAGIEEGFEPTTWQEFLEVCQKIRDNTDATPISLVGDGSVEAWTLSEFLADVLGPDELSKIGTGEIKMESDLFSDLYTEYKKIFDLGYVNEDYKSTDYNATNADFCANKTAIIFGGSWGHSSLYELMGDGVGTFRIPAYSAESKFGDYIISQPGISLSVMNTTKNPDAAVDFIRIFTDGEYQQVDCSQFGNIPSNKKADPSFIQNPLTQISNQWIQNDKNLIGFDSLISAEAANEFYKQTVPVNSGEMTPKQLGKILDDIMAK